jgi:hypothetical protein
MLDYSNKLRNKCRFSADDTAEELENPEEKKGQNSISDETRYTARPIRKGRGRFSGLTRREEKDDLHRGQL